MFEPHALRGAVLAEVHARPFHPVSSPARVLHFAFLTDAVEAATARAALAAFCAANGAAGPAAGARHHRVVLGGGTLRWEQHSEFTTYTWEFAAAGNAPFQPPAAALASAMRALPQPGPHLVSVDLHLVAAAADAAPERLFEEQALVGATLDGGEAMMATDFRPCPDGFVRILVRDIALTPYRAGSLCQRLIELETYRTLALLGLPEAQRLAQPIHAIEDGLARIARDMTRTEGLEADQSLLDELTALAARLEADTAASSFRFGASRAYDSIVQQRLAVIDEKPLGHLTTVSAFLARRMAPAMRTCQTMEERQAALAVRLGRAANLLRTKVDVSMERQNRDLLAAMSERARLQLRLQQTVEGLSVAAISYYVIALAGHVFEGAEKLGLHVEPTVATAILVPVVVAAIALMVRRVRRRHSGEH